MNFFLFCEWPSGSMFGKSLAPMKPLARIRLAVFFLSASLRVLTAAGRVLVPNTGNQLRLAWRRLASRSSPDWFAGTGVPRLKFPGIFQEKSKSPTPKIRPGETHALTPSLSPRRGGRTHSAWEFSCSGLWHRLIATHLCSCFFIPVLTAGSGRHSARRSSALAGFILCGAILLVAGRSLTQAAEEKAQPTLYYIPHTHWEGAVFKTREGYLEMGLPNILKALRLLKMYPNYKFTLDQVAYIKPFLERYPEEAQAFRRFISEGRLEIVGGMDVMPDDVKPGGELFVRQMHYGKRYCREKLGVEVTTGWFLDTFGHHPQMPQLLALAGYKSFWFCRGLPHNRLPSEFRWQG